MSAMPVVYSFARSGGTLVNQLLGVHRDCLVLSEVNPAASVMPVAEQAAEWLGLASQAEVGTLASRPYREQIRTVGERAARAGKTLVVRDWVTVNFLAGTSAHVVPSGELEQALYLGGIGYAAKPVVVARRSRAVYDSIRRSFPHLRHLELEIFAPAYLRYARAVSGFPVGRLEELRARPEAGLRDVLGALGLDSSDARGLLERFGDFRNCTGNTTLKSPVASSTAREVLAPDERDDAKPAHPGMLEADGLPGYAA